MGKLLLYRARDGEGRFYDFRFTVDFQGGIQGGISLLKTHGGWRTNWKQIVPGLFGGPGSGGPGSSLLFYDGAGTGEFRTIDENNDIPLIKTHTGWVGANVPWTHIIPGKFSEKEKIGYTGLLFYDSAGTGAFYQTYGQGELAQLKRHTGWVGANVPWTHIIPLKADWTGTPSPQSERLLFYDSAGTGAFYRTYGEGELWPLKTHTGWQSAGKPWTHLIPLLTNTFRGTPSERLFHLVFYDSVGGDLADYTYNALGEMALFKGYPGFGAGWQQVIPLLMPGPTLGGPNGLLNVLLFYEGASGRALLYRYDEGESEEIPYSGFSWFYNYNFPASCQIITVTPY